LGNTTLIIFKNESGLEERFENDGKYMRLEDLRDSRQFRAVAI